MSAPSGTGMRWQEPTVVSEVRLFGYACVKAVAHGGGSVRANIQNRDKYPKSRTGDLAVKAPEWIKPAALGMIGGAIAAIVIGFAWGGWVTGGTAERMEIASGETAIVLAFTPLCVARAEQQPERVAAMMEERRWARRNFVIEAGWVDNVSERYRSAVANACAAALVEGMSAD